jgi:two-component system sensor histidine kinase AtoS
VLLNLFNNAIEAAKTTVSVNARPWSDHTEITIHDDGPGIPPADRERVFEPFFTTKKGGTGLGLPICRKFVEDHGGTLEIVSTQGEGTTVLLTLRV